MKGLFVVTFLFALLAAKGYAGETTTICPMMREQNERSNPKLNMHNLKLKPKSVKSSASKAQ